MMTAKDPLIQIVCLMKVYYVMQDFKEHMTSSHIEEIL